MFYLLYVYLSPLISDAFGFQVRFCQTSISMQELQNVVLEVTESLPILWEHWHSSFVDRRTNMVHPKPLKSTVNHRGRQRCDKHFYDLLCHIGKSFGLSICPFHFRMDSPRWTAHNANRAFALRVHNLPILGLAKMQSCREWIRSSGRWSRGKTGSDAQSVDICVKEKVDAISWLAHLNSATLAGENGRCDYCCDLLCVLCLTYISVVVFFLQYGSASTCFYWFYGFVMICVI